MDCDRFLYIRHRRSDSPVNVQLRSFVLELHSAAFLFWQDYAIMLSSIFYYQNMFAIRRLRLKKCLIYLWSELPCRLPAFVKPPPQAALATRDTRTHAHAFLRSDNIVALDIEADLCKTFPWRMAEHEERELRESQETAAGPRWETVEWKWLPARHNVVFITSSICMVTGHRFSNHDFTHAGPGWYRSCAVIKRNIIMTTKFTDVIYTSTTLNWFAVCSCSSLVRCWKIILFSYFSPVKCIPCVSLLDLNKGFMHSAMTGSSLANSLVWEMLLRCSKADSISPERSRDQKLTLKRVTTRHLHATLTVYVVQPPNVIAQQAQQLSTAACGRFHKSWGKSNSWEFECNACASLMKTTLAFGILFQWLMDSHFLTK